MTVNIDGRAVEPIGSLLDTLLAADVDVPHLCKDDNLPALGACRTCLVEADGRIVASCAVPAAAVREVSTSSGRVVAIRATVLALTAAMQAAGEPPPGGPCSGEARIAFDAFGGGRWQLPVHTGAHLDDSNPFFAFHEDQCILCGRCTAACQVLQHIGAIGIAGRGRSARVTPGPGVTFRESICTSCGSCVAACPTSALRPRKKERP